MSEFTSHPISPIFFFKPLEWYFKFSQFNSILCHYIHYQIKRRETDKRNNISYVSFKIRKVHYFFVVTVSNEFRRRKEIGTIIQLDEYSIHPIKLCYLWCYVIFKSSTGKQISLRSFIQTNANEFEWNETELKNCQILWLYLILN